MEGVLTVRGRDIMTREGGKQAVTCTLWAKLHSPAVYSLCCLSFLLVLMFSRCQSTCFGGLGGLSSISALLAVC